MQINLPTTIAPKNIPYPRTMVIEALGLLAVFRTPTDFMVILSDTELVGARTVYTDKFSTEVDGHKWEHAADENLIWCVEDLSVGFQDGDDVTIVDSMAGVPTCEEPIDITTKEWVNVQEFAKEIRIGARLLFSPINQDEVVIFSTTQEIEDYVLMVDGEVKENAFDSPLIPEDVEEDFPLILGKTFAFPMTNAKRMLEKKDVLGSLSSYQDWKSKRAKILQP